MYWCFFKVIQAIKSGLKFVVGFKAQSTLQVPYSKYLGSIWYLHRTCEFVCWLDYWQPIYADHSLKQTSSLRDKKPPSDTKQARRIFLGEFLIKISLFVIYVFQAFLMSNLSFNWNIFHQLFRVEQEISVRISVAPTRFSLKDRRNISNNFV